MSLAVSDLQYDEMKAEYCSNVKYGRGGIAAYKEIKAYIFEKYGVKMSSLYVGQIKDAPF